jgi:hypothetical protein
MSSSRPASLCDLTATASTASMYIASCLGRRPPRHFGHLFDWRAVSPENAIA